MKTAQTLKLFALFFVVALGEESGSVRSQSPPPPTQSKGVITVKPLTAVDLGPEIEGMQGRHFRMRLVTLEPGAVFGLHNHRDNPGMLYVLSGKIVEHRAGVSREFGPGEFWSESKETEHWSENRGAVPVVALVVDIFRQP